MQQRRLRPGDVLDDYCPRERRITDHAIVAMIDDHIKQTRCVVCDAEHEYKEAKVPPQRRKKTPALFTQVLDGLQGPTRRPHLPDDPTDDPPFIPEEIDASPAPSLGVPAALAAAGRNGSNGDAEAPVVPEPITVPAVAEGGDGGDESILPQDEGPVRRTLIRASLPRPEGQQPPARVMPEFTIRQPMKGRGPRISHRRAPQHNGGFEQGGGRFGRGGHGGHRQHGGRGQGNPNGNRSRRGGKKR